MSIAACREQSWILTKLDSRRIYVVIKTVKTLSYDVR
jgi:hypothetical protein